MSTAEIEPTPQPPRDKRWLTRLGLASLATAIGGVMLAWLSFLGWVFLWLFGFR